MGKVTQAALSSDLVPLERKINFFHAGFLGLRAEFRLGPLGPAAEQCTFFRFHSILLKPAGKESQPKFSINPIR